MEKPDILELELDAIVKSSKDNIVITDGNGIVLRASPNSVSIYGNDASFLIGKSVFELEKNKIFSPSVTVKVLKDRKEVQLMQHTTTGRTVMATGIPVFDELGEIIRVISFSHDLTEIQNLKEEYEELSAKMARYQSEIQLFREKGLSMENMILKSKSMQKIWQLVQRVAKTELTVYDWPGNVRELQNMIERLVITAEGKTILPDTLPFYMQHEGRNTADRFHLEERASTLKEVLEEVEIKWLKRAARQCKTTYEMADYLGLNQSNVVRKLKKYGINLKSH